MRSTRVSTDQGFEQDFNSLDAQREASEASRGLNGLLMAQSHHGQRRREHLV